MIKLRPPGYVVPTLEERCKYERTIRGTIMLM